MSPLEALQRSLAATLAHGPAHLQPALFAGPVDRLLLGLKAHANTISHARLVALEDTYPHSREAIGHAAFHALSRAFLDTAGTTATALAEIGHAYPGFLASHGIAPGLVDLARAEWAWLSSWKAADASPFDLAQIAGQPEAELLGTAVCAHRAAHLLSLFEPAGVAFATFGDLCGARILLFTRPAERVVVTPLDPAERAMFARLKAISAAHPVTIGGLLARMLEEDADEDPAAAFLALAGAGAIALAKDIS